MTEPTTPTGQAILHYGQQSEARMTPEEWTAWWKPRIFAIEREERERLLLVIDSYVMEHGPIRNTAMVRSMLQFADPEDDDDPR